MEFAPNEDQAAAFGALDQIMVSGAAAWSPSKDFSRCDWSVELDRTLDENGFFDAAREETLGATAAAEIVYRLSTLPVLVECAASSLLRSRFFPEWPRPVAVVDGDARQPVRFLPVARSALRLAPEGVAVALVEPGAPPQQSLFAYPLAPLDARRVEWKPLDVDPEAVRRAWSVAVAAEIAGALRGGLDSVVAHVRERRQFGRPLGSFQAIQHRLADDVAKIEGARLLVLRAAQDLDPADAAVALGYVQSVAGGVVYDLHQFMGAMGVTLEHPLHRWTYRVRLLRSSLGGAEANFQRVCELRWIEADRRASSQEA